MMREIKMLLGLSPKTEAELAADREIQTLRSKYKTEQIGVHRARIMLRTKLMNELIEGPEPPAR